MEDIQKKFLPRFVALAKERIGNGLRVAKDADGGDEALHLARELHSMAGEAGLLGLGHLLSLARGAEEAATQLHAVRSDPRRVALATALLVLQSAICNVERELETG